MPSVLLEERKEIAPKGVKKLSQRKINVQLWMSLVVEVKSEVVKNILCRNLEC